MTNLANALKEEIRRLARKEIRAQVSTTKRAATQHRREIAKMKRQIQQQAKQLSNLAAQGQRGGGAEPQSADDAMTGVRFSSRSVRAQRKRLRLSAEEYGKLVGVSGQTIYSWEQGNSRPRKSQMGGLIAARSLGRREALARLESLGAETAGSPGKGRRMVHKPR